MTVKKKAPGSKDESRREQREVARAAGLVSFGTLLSRIMGMLRDVAIAGVFGAGLMSDAFFVAFRVPNLIRRLIGEGPMSSAFIPVFTEYREKKSSPEAWKLASNLTGLMGGLSLLLSVAGIYAAPLIVRVIAPEWDVTSLKGGLTVRLTRLMFPYLFLVVLYALAMAVLNSCRRFFVPAMAPALLNLGMIWGALVLAPYFDPPILGLAWGVLLGGAVQLGVNIPSLKAVGYRWQPGFDFRDEGVRRVGRLMVPTVIGLAVNDVNQVVDTILASMLTEGSVSWLYYGSRLTQLPLGLVGIAVGTAILPTLSSQSARSDIEGLKETVSFGLRVVLYLTLPAIAGLAVLRLPIAALIFQRGEFTAADTMATGSAILYYSLGMWAAGGIRILASAFYSVKDTRTPFYTAAAAMAVNIVLNLYLMTVMAHAGLALASSLSVIFQFLILLQLLRRSLGPLGLVRILKGVARMLLASVVMGGVCALTLGLLPAAHLEGMGMRVAIVAGEMVLGAAVYLSMSRLLGCEEYLFIADLLKRRFGRAG
jgi:putative peptidoglycan lipid II flippase